MKINLSGISVLVVPSDIQDINTAVEPMGSEKLDFMLDIALSRHNEVDQTLYEFIKIGELVITKIWNQAAGYAIHNRQFYL